MSGRVLAPAAVALFCIVAGAFLPACSPVYDGRPVPGTITLSALGEWLCPSAYAAVSFRQISDYDGGVTVEWSGLDFSPLNGRGVTGLYLEYGELGYYDGVEPAVLSGSYRLGPTVSVGDTVSIRAVAQGFDNGPYEEYGPIRSSLVVTQTAPIPSPSPTPSSEPTPVPSSEPSVSPEPTPEVYLDMTAENAMTLLSPINRMIDIAFVTMFAVMAITLVASIV